jgi:hypothetical protein
LAILPRSFAVAPGQPIRLTRLEPAPVWAPSLAWSAARRPAPALSAFLDFVFRHPELVMIGDKRVD